MVFCNTKIDCERQSQARRHQGHGAVAIHGDKDQWERERALQQFSTGQAPVMFCTDVAARGLHVEDVSLVVNYDMPQGDGVEDYVHRIGRTGRAGKAGAAITFWDAKKDSKTARPLVTIMKDAGQEVC